MYMGKYGNHKLFATLSQNNFIVQLRDTKVTKSDKSSLIFLFLILTCLHRELNRGSP